MSVEDLSVAVSSVVINAIADFVNFIPSLVGGLVVLLIGLVIGAIVYRAVVGLLKTLRVEKFLTRYNLVTIDGHEIDWPEIFGELSRWAIVIVFLIPTFQAWHLDAVNTVLNRVVLYIPNVIVSVVLAIVGLVFAKLGYKIAYGSARSLGRDLSNTVGLIAEWSIKVFVAFLVLHQLGVAQELLRILFAGLVAMIAIAGGLAFGLGGQETAKNMLNSVWEKFNKS